VTPLIVSPGPRLEWKALRPGRRRSETPAPFDTARTHYVFSGRTAIFHGLRVLGISSGERVLVPAFNCASLVEPILRHGAKVAFYKINTDCSADVDDLARRIDAQTRAIVVIHYFGFPERLEPLRRLCAGRGLYLIEDCAHVLAGESASAPLGATGDVSIFSWRKFLPVGDGGQLVVNNPALTAGVSLDRPRPLLRVKAFKDAVDRLLESPNALARCANRVWRLPSTIRRGPLAPAPDAVSESSASSASSPAPVDELDLGCPFTLVNLPMTAFSRFVARHIDLRAIIERRRRNYLYVQQLIGGLPGVRPVFKDLPDGVCPLAFPFFVEGRKDFHLLLRAKGIPASTWGGVIHPVLSLDDFPESRTLYDGLIYLPVHQSLTVQEMDTMGRAVREAL
jgi:dTDP-4-amino-4,6-dideoxygalactose transaminase